MKHLKKAVVILMTTLMCITNFTTVFADDEQATAEPESLYSAHYEFVLKDSDEELPEEIMALLPDDKTDLKNGTVVTVEKIEDVSVDGVTYNFLGWDKGETVIQDSDITFTGTWGKDVVKIESVQNSVDTSTNNTETPVEEQKENYVNIVNSLVQYYEIERDWNTSFKFCQYFSELSNRQICDDLQKTGR